MIDTVNTPTASLITGCTVRQLQHWRIRGYVNPVKRVHGNGRIRWNADDLLRAALLRNIVRDGHDASEMADKITLDHDLLMVHPVTRAVDYADVPEIVAQHCITTLLPIAPLRKLIAGRMIEFEEA